MGQKDKLQKIMIVKLQNVMHNREFNPKTISDIKKKTSHIMTMVNAQ